MPYFQQTPFIPLAYVAGAELLVIILVCIDLVRALYARGHSHSHEKRSWPPLWQVPR